MDSKNIVVVGAGYSGVLTAKRLAKKFKKQPEVSITIIDRNPFHTMLTELHEVAAGRVEEESIRMSLSRIFTGRRVNVVTDEVQSIIFDKKTVACSNGSYPYDYLVIAAGSRPTGFGVPGMEENTYKLWSYEDAVKLHERINECFRLAMTETDPAKKQKLLTFSVVGAGFTGTEMVGELAEYVPVLCRKYEIPRELVKLNVIDVLDRVVPTLPEHLSAKVELRLRKMGVEVHLQTKVVEIGTDFISTEKAGKTTTISGDTIIWVAGVESSELTTEVAKNLKSAGRGRIATDKYLRSVDDQSVYVVGDNIFYIPEGEKAPVPQMVENCEQSAHTAADNIVAAINGGEMKEYKPSFHGVMVCVGGRYGAAYVGGKNKVSLPSFLAMFVKHFINIVYFVQVMGWNKVVSYLKHEFFTIRDKRSFVGGHFSNRIPNFITVPLRLWLGAVWLFEGIMKIVGGWFDTPQLTKFFSDANSWFEPILTGKASDAVSSATGTSGSGGDTVGTIILNFDFLGLFKFIFVSGKDLAESKLENLAIKLDIPLMNTLLDNFVLSNDTMQMIMQVFVVVLEIAIGLSLISGLFTTPSSLVSIVLMCMFLTTTGLFLNQIWMIFAAIALLFSGRVFGFDYYTTPFLKKHWKRNGWVKRSYLYHD